MKERYNCPHCGGKARKNGKDRKKREGYSRFVCNDCKKEITCKIEDMIHIKDGHSFSKVENANELEITVNKEQDDIRTLDQLVSQCHTDLNIWQIDRHILNKWGTNHQVKAWLSKIKPDIQIVPVLKPVIFKVPNFKSNQSKYEYSDTSIKFKKSLIFSDAQIGFLKNHRTGELLPFQDRLVLDTIMKVAELEQPDEIILNGDMIDCTEASSFSKKEAFYFTFQPAINEFGWLLTKLRLTCPDSKIVWLLGNHEERLDRVMNEHMIYAYQLKAYRSKHRVMSWRNLLNLDELGVEIIEDYPSGSYSINNKLDVEHGYVINLKTRLVRTGKSIIQGHIHTDETVSKTLHTNGVPELISITSMPCTCKIDGTVPGKTPTPNWQQGFSFVESSENRFNRQNVLVIDGKCIWRGQLVEGVDYTDEIDKIINDI